MGQPRVEETIVLLYFLLWEYCLDALGPEVGSDDFGRGGFVRGGMMPSPERADVGKLREEDVL